MREQTFAKPISKRRRMTLEEWRAEGRRRFGEQGRDWRFRCVACGAEQSGADFLELGFAPEVAMTKAYFACIGRHDPERGCDWSLGGLLQLHTLEVVDEGGNVTPVFEFADAA